MKIRNGARQTTFNSCAQCGTPIFHAGSPQVTGKVPPEPASILSPGYRLFDAQLARTRMAQVRDIVDHAAGRGGEGFDVFAAWVRPSCHAAARDCCANSSGQRCSTSNFSGTADCLPKWSYCYLAESPENGSQSFSPDFGSRYKFRAALLRLATRNSELQPERLKNERSRDACQRVKRTQ